MSSDLAHGGRQRCAGAGVTHTRDTLLQKESRGSDRPGCGGTLRVRDRRPRGSRLRLWTTPTLWTDQGPLAARRVGMRRSPRATGDERGLVEGEGWVGSEVAGWLATGRQSMWFR